MDLLQDEGPFVDHVQTFYHFQVVVLFLVVLRGLSVAILHLEGFSSLAVHEGFAEILVSSVETFATEEALACLLEHLHILENTTSLQELLEGLCLLALQLLLQSGELASIHFFDPSAALLDGIPF